MILIRAYRNVACVNSRWLHQEGAQILTKRKVQPKTSGIIVTGDEVLKGQVLDTNSCFLCKKLYEMGIRVVAVSKVPDNVDIITEEVKKFSREYDYVLTTGGIGPTHDDVTYEAVAKAFDDELYYNPEIKKLVLDFFKTTDPKHPALKMAYIPSKAKLTYGYDPVTKKTSLYPNVSLKNVFMFPGVPYWCERIFNFAGSLLFESIGKFYLRELYLTINEGVIVGKLNDAVKQYPNILFGSYPKFFHSYYNVKIQIESYDETKVIEAYEYLKRMIPKEFQTEYDHEPFVDKKRKISQFKNRFLFQTLDQLRALIKSNNSNDIFLYFDGGKNSTVLLHILTVLYEELCPNNKVNGIYVEVNSRINKFVTECTQNYGLNLLKLSKDNFKNFAMSSPKICVIKGTRKSDPEYKSIITSFEGLRIINPLSHWKYHDVWKLLRGLCLPYCELYDQGYSSICHSNCAPNSNLLTIGPRRDTVYYKKACDLEDEALENAH